MKNLLILLLLFYSCSVVLAQEPIASNKIVMSIPHDSGVLLLPVLLSYVDINTDAPLNPIFYKGNETSEVFDSLVLEDLLKLGIRTVLLNANDSLQNEMLVIRKDLLRPRIPPVVLTKVALITQAVECRYTLVCSLKVKVGPGGYWDPTSGSIGSSSSYARIHATLLDSYSTDGSVWHQDVEIRKLPKPQSKRFAEAVHLLIKLLK